jgi:hypothetical protein
VKFRNFHQLDFLGAKNWRTVIRVWWDILEQNVCSGSDLNSIKIVYGVCLIPIYLYLCRFICIFIKIENITRKSDWKSVLQEKFESITAKEKIMHCSLEKLIQPSSDSRKVCIAGCRKMSIMSSDIIHKSGSSKKDALSTRSVINQTY